MSTDKLMQLFSLCKCGVFVTANAHRDYYETVEQYFKDNQSREDVPDDVFAEMIKRDTIYCIQFYPHTPVGFDVVYHYDFHSALDLALESCAEALKKY